MIIFFFFPNFWTEDWVGCCCRIVHKFNYIPCGYSWKLNTVKGVNLDKVCKWHFAGVVWIQVCHVKNKCLASCNFSKTFLVKYKWDFLKSWVHIVERIFLATFQLHSLEELLWYCLWDSYQMKAMCREEARVLCRWGWTSNRFFVVQVTCISQT